MLVEGMMVFGGMREGIMEVEEVEMKVEEVVKIRGGDDGGTDDGS